MRGGKNQSHKLSVALLSPAGLPAVWCLLLALVSGGVAASARGAGADALRPNFVLILADDLGYGDVGTYHPSDVHTPQLDHLAAEGLLFTAMRANCTVCSPSRAALLTGRYADRVGVPGVIRTHADNSWGYLDPSVATLGNVLQAHGYHTAAIGKWHLGLEAPNLPNDRGFDFFHGFLGDMMDSYLTHLRHGENYLRRNTQLIDPPGHATDLFTQWAVEYLQQRGEQPEQPFFLYLAYNAPHFPIEPPESELLKVRQRAPQLDAARAANVALVEHLDASLGRVLEALQQAGLEQNTLVVFSSDNGGSLPHSQNNDPWRDGKQSHYDGGLRVPFVMRWPAKIAAGGRSDYQGLNFDVFPTFAELAGGQPAGDLDAVSLSPLLNGDEMPTGRELYFVRREGGPAYAGKSYHALIHEGWKLMQNDPFSPLELYHLQTDPQEQHNLAKSQPQRLRQLTARLQAHIQRGGATAWQPPRR